MPLKATVQKAAYDKEHCRRIVMKLNKTTDADILEMLDTQDSMQGYIRQLIREDIERKKNAAK